MIPDPSTGGPNPVVIDRSGVGRCFGCGQANEDGLQLRFHRYDDGTIESRHRAAANHCGLDTVVHGGIQATILDEVMGVAAQHALPADASDLACVTVEMNLRYRRPVAMADDVVARARVERVDGSDIHVTGALVAADDTPLTVATSRWRQLKVDPA